MAGIASKLARDRANTLGIGTNENPRKYLNQDFEALRAQCLASKTLFEDPTFPAAQSSLGVKDLGPNSEKVQGLVWKRPSDIKPNPQFINEGASRADVRQGALGDCWLLCSIASLTLNKECLCRVVPIDQSFDADYAGIFHFKFWQYGEWVDVVVDDRLPTKKSKLLFVKSTSASEFWSALLEKAYAKVNGSYEALIGGLPLEALEDFTGGVGELYYFSNAPDNLFQIIQKALRQRSLVTCCTQSSDGKGEIVVNTNVVKNHAYSLTGAEEIPYRGDTVQIVRVRNPWGYKEWNGAWSDGASEWNEVDPNVRADLRVECDDGEAWMPFSSFLVEFYRVEICHLCLVHECCNDKHKWCLTEYNGSWTAGCTAGGCKGNPNFWTNPQFRIKLEEPDEDPIGGTGRSLCTVIVSLIQKERRRKKPEGGELFSIGYYVYKSPSNGQLGKDFFKKNKEVARTDIYKSHRDVSKRFQLPVGDYVVVPSTYYPSQEADFCIRVFTEREAETLEIGNMVEANVYEPLLNSSPDTEAPTAAEEPDEEKAEYTAEDLRSYITNLLSKRDEIKSDGISVKTCKEMINLLDVDNTGTLSNEELTILRKKLEHYMEIFLESDTNSSGTIDAHEMRIVLQRAGFNLNNRIQEVIVQRYVSGELMVNFEDFIACMIRLETLFKMFNILGTDKDGNISLSLFEWICAGLV
ncbi:calpain-8-like isoform X1 [Hyla sarda]|uniref:calpain-8-like isoform X1 n=1 Tax=Hyla sarda TaxID=327740 RepID=UPI0024C303F2|nr:calpain-8-like isoform X1 [Hyla sarda]XP_056424405.1 calpain-8-like isoform X1 [Hyla sarda]XP_056424406.1 calpain-8-like isoform X1 [Hyla sarda]XP_056424407.1 calpain-8-like isoform X1 [Hyla sarda]XP_056424408.1 calpain-8-like isoform X1 [Hyla sarda]